MRTAHSSPCNATQNNVGSPAVHGEIGRRRRQTNEQGAAEMMRASGTGMAFRPARRRAVCGCLASVLIAVLAVGAAGVAGAAEGKPLPEATFFRIGTAGTAGTYFQIGGLIANALSSPPGTPDCARSNGPSGAAAAPACGVPGLIAVAQATQGSV